eukprot:1143052-Rhodomonas_salina.3
MFFHTGLFIAQAQSNSQHQCACSTSCLHPAAPLPIAHPDRTPAGPVPDPLGFDEGCSDHRVQPGLRDSQSQAEE